MKITILQYRYLCYNILKVKQRGVIMNNVEIIEMLNKIEEYIRNEQLESVLKYIDLKKKDINIKRDIANEYMDNLIEKLK